MIDLNDRQYTAKLLTELKRVQLRTPEDHRLIAWIEKLIMQNRVMGVRTSVYKHDEVMYHLRKGFDPSLFERGDTLQVVSKWTHDMSTEEYNEYLRQRQKNRTTAFRSILL